MTMLTCDRYFLNVHSKKNVPPEASKSLRHSRREKEHSEIPEENNPASRRMVEDFLLNYLLITTRRKLQHIWYDSMLY